MLQGILLVGMQNGPTAMELYGMLLKIWTHYYYVVQLSTSSYISGY